MDDLPPLAGRVAPSRALVPAANSEAMDGAGFSDAYDRAKPRSEKPIRQPGDDYDVKNHSTSNARYGSTDEPDDGRQQGSVSEEHQAKFDEDGSLDEAVSLSTPEPSTESELQTLEWGASVDAKPMPASDVNARSEKAAFGLQGLGDKTALNTKGTQNVGASADSGPTASWAALQRTDGTAKLLDFPQNRQLGDGHGVRLAQRDADASTLFGLRNGVASVQGQPRQSAALLQENGGNLHQSALASSDAKGQATSNRDAWIGISRASEGLGVSDVNTPALSREAASRSQLTGQPGAMSGGDAQALHANFGGDRLAVASGSNIAVSGQTKSMAKTEAQAVHTPDVASASTRPSLAELQRAEGGLSSPIGVQNNTTASAGAQMTSPALSAFHTPAAQHGLSETAAAASPRTPDPQTGPHQINPHQTDVLAYSGGARSPSVTMAQDVMRDAMIAQQGSQSVPMPFDASDERGSDLPFTLSSLQMGQASSAVAQHGAQPATQIAHQVVTALRDMRADPGVPLDLALDPPELGRVRLSVTEVAGAMTLTITAERPETADLMRRHLALLSEEFARAGVEAPNVNISQDGGRQTRDHLDFGERNARSDPADEVMETIAETDRPVTTQAHAAGLDVRI